MGAAKGYSRSQKFVFIRGCVIWLLATLFYFYDNLLKVSPSAMKPELSMSIVKSATDFGSLSAYFLYAYGIMQIPVGVLIDKFGVRRLLSLASISAAAGCFLFGGSQSLFVAKLGRLLIGFGASFAVVSSLKISSLWFHRRYFAFLTGAMVTVGFSGSMVAMRILNNLVVSFGWRDTMNYAGVLGIIIAVLLWLTVRDKPQGVNEVNDSDNETAAGLFSGLKEVVGCSQAWIASIYAGLMFVPTLAFGDLWGTQYLVEAQGMSRAAAGKMISYIYIGWVFGSPIYGWLSDKIGRRNVILYTANIATLIITSTLIYCDNIPESLLPLLLLSLGFFSCGFIVAFAVVRENNRPQNAGVAMGFINAINTFWGAIFQPIIGTILDYVTNTDANGAVVFTLREYRIALTSMPVCLCISLILLMFLRETYCKPKVFK